jgi:hypothetical protein
MPCWTSSRRVKIFERTIFSELTVQSSPTLHLAFHLGIAHPHNQREATAGMEWPMDWKQLLASITGSVTGEERDGILCDDRA